MQAPEVFVVLSVGGGCDSGRWFVVNRPNTRCLPVSGQQLATIRIGWDLAWHCTSEQDVQSRHRRIFTHEESALAPTDAGWTIVLF
jgi:hypothetical protein